MRTFLAFLTLALFGFAGSAAATVAQYEVRGVKANDTLNIRAAPSHTARIVGRIPPNGREIEIIDRGRGSWVKIYYRRTTGFVNRRYLKLSKPRAAQAEPAAVSAPKAATVAPAAVEATPAAVAVDPKALDDAAPVTAEPIAPPALATPPAPAIPGPAKLETPAKPATSLPGSKQDGDETPALMKPPAEMTPESVPAAPAS
jgi:hypothetical protein